MADLISGYTLEEVEVIKQGILDLAVFGFGCTHNIAAPGQPPESCGKDTSDGSDLCLAHRFVVDGDNSDEPSGFDD